MSLCRLVLAPRRTLYVRLLHLTSLTSTVVIRSHGYRLFSTSSTDQRGPKPLPPLPVINDSDITESFLKGSGPGGQAINKTNSAVQLQHHATGFVVKCQDTRSRAQNRSIARRLLQEKLEVHLLGDEARTVKKQVKESNKKASKGKKARRKYRALEEGKADAESEDGEEVRGQAESGGPGSAGLATVEVKHGSEDVPQQTIVTEIRADPRSARPESNGAT